MIGWCVAFALYLLGMIPLLCYIGMGQNEGRLEGPTWTWVLIVVTWPLSVIGFCAYYAYFFRAGDVASPREQGRDLDL